MENLFSLLKNHQDYDAWIDEDTFIDWFIVSEVFKNVDSGYSSIYYYKDKSDVLKSEKDAKAIVENLDFGISHFFQETNIKTNQLSIFLIQSILSLSLWSVWVLSIFSIAS